MKHDRPQDLRASDLLPQMRGGHLWTAEVSQRLGAHLASALGRRGATPNAVSLANLVLGLGTSGAVAALVGVDAVLAGIVGLVGWQVAYALDCGDGQLARATGKGSPDGAVTDLICDFLVQASVVTVLVSIASPELPTDWQVPLSLILALTLLIGVVYSAASAHLVVGAPPRSGRSLPVAAVMAALRDYGAHAAIAPLAIAVGPVAVLWFAIVIACQNAAFLLLRLDVHVRRPLGTVEDRAG